MSESTELTAYENDQANRIHDLSEEIHEMSIEKGFYSHAFVEVRDQRGRVVASVTNPSIVGEKLALATGELSEALEELRKDQPTSVQMEAFGEELADAVIRIFDLAAYQGVPIGHHIIRKIKKNSTRPYLHGKSF